MFSAIVHRSSQAVRLGEVGLELKLSRTSPILSTCARTPRNYVVSKYFSVSKRTPALANPVSPSHDALKSTVSSQAFVQAKKVKTSTIHEEVTEKIPEDGLTRWPSLSTHQGILRGLDWFGTSVFALAGSAAAGNCGMDILGCTVVGTITAVGGGTVRDLLLGATPVFWVHEWEYLIVCIATAIATFQTWKWLEEHGYDDSEVLNWADAAGVGAFCVIGAQAGVRRHLHPLVCILMGMITSTFGGVTRDVLCQKPPRILHSQCEVYATTALFGSSVYVLMKGFGVPPLLRVVSGFSSAVLGRFIAWKYGIRLPDWDIEVKKM